MAQTVRTHYKYIFIKFFLALVLFSLPALMAPGEALSEWPMFMKDRFHSSFAATAPRPPLRVLWTFVTGGPVYSSPVVSGGKVFIGSYDNKLYALKEDSGVKLWSFATGGDIFSTPAVSDGYVYFGSKDGKFYCLKAGDGSLVWSFTTDGPILTSPVVGDGNVFFGSSDMYFYALDAATGKKIWRTKLHANDRYSGIYSSPLYYKGSVVFAGKNGIVYSQDGKSRGRNWTFISNSSIYSSPVEKDGVIYVSFGKRKLLGMNAESGEITLRKNTGKSLPYSSPVVAGGKIYQAFKDGHIKAYGMERGKVLADYKLPGPVNSTPVVTSNGFLYVGCADGRLYAIDIILGEVSWSYTTGGGVHSSPAISGGRLFVGSKDGSLYAFGQ